MRRFYTQFFSFLLIISLGLISVLGQTNPTPISSFPYTQNFNGIAAYPSGWQGWGFGTSTSTTPVTTAATSNVLFTTGITNATNSTVIGSLDNRLGIMVTGSNVLALAFAMNTTGHNNINVKYKAATQRTENARTYKITLQYRIGTTGSFVSLDSSAYTNVKTPTSTTGTAFVDQKSIEVLLPAACNNQSIVQLRWITTTIDGSGNRPSFSIDDVEVTVAPTLCTAPTETPVGFSDYSTADENSIDLEWLDGNGSGRVIVMNTTNSFTDLVDGANPTANLTYSGSEQVIYNGTGTGPITVTGLLANTTYYFKGFEYCSPDKVYNNAGTAVDISTAVGSDFIIITANNYGPFCNLTSNDISVVYSSTGSFTGTFKAQLSNGSGVFPLDATSNIIGSGTSPITATIPANTTAGSGYRVRVVNGAPLAFGDDNGSNITIVASPTTPTTVNPRTICEGATASIVATGSNNASGYTFWNQLTGGSQITAGVTGNTLTTPTNLSLGTHSYFIQGENGICVSTRKEVVVAVIASPATPSGTFTYSANPSCGQATLGYDAGFYFQTASDGELLTYPTSAPFTLNASGRVFVRAYNGTCWSSNDTSTIVTINNAINISSQPSNINIVEGGSNTISITASNVASYQWQVNDGCGWSDLSNAGKYSGTSTSTLTISNPTLDMNDLQYRVVLTGATPCSDVNSNVSTLTITKPSGSIWSNPITSPSAGINSPYISGQTVTSNLTVSGLELFGSSKASANDRFNSSQWLVSLDENKYFSWTLTPNSGFELNISSLDFSLQSSNSGPNMFAVRTSMDGFDSNLYNSAKTQGNEQSFAIPVNITNKTSSVEIRLYAYGYDNTGGTFSVNDFDFKGSLVLVCTPPTIETQPNDISACYNKFKVETFASSPTYQWEVYDANASSWSKILSCNSDYSGAQADQLNLTGTLSSLDGNQYRVKVISNDCPIYSDIATYSAQPIIVDVSEIGASYLDASSCDYNGWTYYTSDDLEGRYAFAINWALSGIISSANQNAKDDAEVIVTLDNNSFSNENVIGGIAYSTYTMKRYWNVNTTSTIDEPVNVQFPYLQSEVDQIVNAAQNYLALNPSSLYENFNWFKLEGSNFTPNSSVVTPVNIMNSIPLTDVYAGQSPTGFKIAQFNNITSFSGGTGATGVGGLNNPLPVTLLYFMGNCQNDNVNLSWATATELNADKFIIQASDNGKDYFSIGEVKASGNSNTIQQYTFNTTGNFNYFQLKQVDFDGKFELSKIVVTPCNSVNDAFKAFYSTNEGFVVEMLSSTNKKVQLNITSVNGQLIYNQTKNVVKGNQIWNFSSNNLPVGIYIITVADQFDSKSTKVSVY